MRPPTSHMLPRKGGVRLTPAELRAVFQRHDVRGAVSWQVGYFIAILFGAGSISVSIWLFLVVALGYAFNAYMAYRRWKAMEKAET